MSTTHQHKGDRIPWTAGTTAISSDDVVVVRSGTTGMVGVAVADIAASGTGQLEITGVHKLAKTTGSATTFSAGDLVYWDAADSACNTDATGNVNIGIAVEAAVAADATMLVKLHGT